MRQRSLRTWAGKPSRAVGEKRQLGYFQLKKFSGKMEGGYFHLAWTQVNEAAITEARGLKDQKILKLTELREKVKRGGPPACSARR